MSDIPVPGGNENQISTIVVGGVVIALAVISVALRFYTRIFTKAGLGLDDWLIFAAVITTLLTGILLVWGNAVDPNGSWVTDNTDPAYQYTPEDILYLRLAFATSVLYFTIVGSTKLSILLMYNRLFSIDRKFRRQLAVVGVMVLGFWVGCTIATLTNCIPLKWSWLNSLSDARYCFNYNFFWMAAGICEVLIDCFILALPIRVVLRLQLSGGRKAVIALVFLLGGFVIITGMIKVIFGYVRGSRVPSYSRTEVWTTVHTGMAIVCACLPIFKPLLKRISKSTWISRMGKLFPCQWLYSSYSASKCRITRSQEVNAIAEEYSSEVELGNFR